MPKGLLDAKRMIGDIDLGYDGIAGRPARVTMGGHIYGRPTQDIYALSTVQNYVLGAERSDNTAKFRYCSAGAAPLTPGRLQQSVLPDATNTNLVPVGLYAIGAQSFSITLGAGGATLNQYAYGTLVCHAGTGIGTKLRILTNTLAVGAVACTIVTADPTPIAFDGTSRFALTMSKFAATIIHPSPPTALVVAVPLLAVPASNFYWGQVRGECPVLTDLVVNIGQFVKPSRNVDGAVQAADLSMLTGASVAAAVGALSGALPLTSQGAEGVARIVDTVASTRYDLGQMETIVGRVVRVGPTTEMSVIDLMLD